MAGDPINASSAPLLDHLEALRHTFLRMAGVFIFCCIPGWIFAPELLENLLDHAAPAGFKLNYFSVMEPFFVRLELTLVISLLVSFPFCIAFLWHFIAPALHPKEHKSLLPALLISLLLGYAGAAVALFFMIPAVISFSLSFASAEIQPVIGIGSFTSLLLGMILAGAAMFQFPLLIYAALVCGIVSLPAISRKRPVVIVVILVLSAILTPPDVASQLLMAIPAWLLFELTLIFYKLTRRTAK